MPDNPLSQSEVQELVFDVLIDLKKELLGKLETLASTITAAGSGVIVKKTGDGVFSFRTAEYRYVIDKTTDRTTLTKQPLVPEITPE